MGFSVILDWFDIDKIRAYLAYKRSTKVYWASLRIEAQFLLYEFSSVRVSRLADGSRYHGCRIAFLGQWRELADFPPFPSFCL